MDMSANPGQLRWGRGPDGRDTVRARRAWSRGFIPAIVQVVAGSVVAAPDSSSTPMACWLRTATSWTVTTAWRSFCPTGLATTARSWRLMTTEILPR